MTWKYFKPEEVQGLSEDLVAKLEAARELFDAPIVITSGYRDPQHNVDVGGVKDSAHTRGFAVDIKCTDPFMQGKLCWALGLAGLRRVGKYPVHIHCDIDPNLPQNVFWEGHY